MILMYHKVAPETPTMWWVSADAFYRQMWELRGKKVVYLDDYVAGNESNVCITFDGIYDNVCTFAVPILEQFGYPYELFVVSGSIGAGNEFDSVEPPARFADRDQLRDAVARGGRLQWHTQTHQRLTDDLPLKTLRNELQVPRELRDLDPHGFRWVAYPHGEFTARTVKEAKRFFNGGVSCHQGDGKSPLELNRLTVVDETRILERRIGVVIPSYNYGAFLAEAAESVLRQRIQPDRILIIDDASTDDTEAIGRSLQQSDPNLVTFERNKKNLGIVGTFNKAVEIMETDYVVFLGADNRFFSNYVEKCSGVLDSDPAVGVAYTDYALFGPRAPIVHGQFPEQRRGRVLHDTFWLIHFPEQPGEVTRLMAGGKENVIHGSAMFRRQAWVDAGGYRKFEEYPEDFDLFRRILKAGWKPQKARGTYLEYRHHSAQQANASLQTATTIRVLKEAVASMRAEAEEKARLAKLAEEEADTKAQQVLHFQSDAEERAKHIAILQRENEEKTKQVLHFQRDGEERAKHIGILQRENEEKTKQVLHFQRHAEEQAKHIGILQQENDEKTRQVTHFQGEAREKAQRLGELQRESEQTQRQLAQLRQEDEAKSQQLAQVLAENEARSKRLAVFQRRSELKSQRISQLKQRIQHQLQQIAEFERTALSSSEVIEARWKMLTLQADLLRQSEGNAASKALAIQVQDQLEAATSDRDQLRGMIMALQTDIEQARLELGQLQQSITLKSDQILDLQAENEQAKLDIERLETQRQQTDEELRRSSAELDAIRSELRTALGDKEKAVGEVERLKDRSDQFLKLQSENEQAKLDIARLETQRQQTDEELRRSSAELDRMRSELRTVLGDKEKAATEIERLQRLEQTNDQRKQGASELTDARWEMLTLRADILRRIELAESSRGPLIQLQDQLETAASDRDQLRGMLMALQTDLEQERLNITALRGELGASEHRVSQREEHWRGEMAGSGQRIREQQVQLALKEEQLRVVQEKGASLKNRFNATVEQLHALQALLITTRKYLSETARDLLNQRAQMALLRQRVARRLILPFGKSQRKLEELTRES